jgi:hypothetical protein
MRSFTGLMGAEEPCVVFHTAVVLFTVKLMVAGKADDASRFVEAVNG